MSSTPPIEASSGRRHIFAYGSLMYSAVWSRIVRGEYRSRSATIHGFRRVCVRGHEHPALVIAPRAEALSGVLYYDVGPDDVARLDHFETANYARVLVAATVEGAAIAASAYLALNVDDLLDQDWDAARFEHTGLAKFLTSYAVANCPPD